MHLHVQMKFSCEKNFALWTLHRNICNSSSANMAIQHTVASTVLHAAVAPILEGVSGTLAVHDSSELRHDCMAVASEDTNCICLLLHLFASAMACREIMIQRVVPGGLVSCLHKLAGSNGKAPIVN